MEYPPHRTFDGGIICEYTRYGRSCPDPDCILDHTPLLKVDVKVELIQSTLTHRPDGHSWSFLTQRWESS